MMPRGRSADHDLDPRRCCAGLGGGRNGGDRGFEPVVGAGAVAAAAHGSAAGAAPAASTGAAASDARLRPGRRGSAGGRTCATSADDRLEGRADRTSGYRKAAEYVAPHQREYGLEPAGTDGYFSPCASRCSVRAADSHLALLRGGKVDRLDLGEDALLGARLPQPVALRCCWSSSATPSTCRTRGRRDDLAAIDCKGKVVVFINGGPADIAGALKSHARAAQEFTKALQEAGAVGAISIPNPSSMDIPWGRMSLAASQPGMRVAEADLQDTHGTFPSPTSIRRGRVVSPARPSSGRAAGSADAGKPLPRFALPVTLRARSPRRPSRSNRPT